MKKQQALELTERLREYIELGPGNNQIIRDKATRALTALQSADLGMEAEGKCVELRALFGQWFSSGPWTRPREGDNVQRELYRQLGGLETCIDVWFSADDRRSAPYDEQAD